MSFPVNHSKKIDMILAAETAEGNVDPCNDQIWHLTTEEGEPKALAISTSYGLRAYGMRVFPRFHMKNEIATDPRSFSKYPSPQFCSSNFIEIKLSPFPSVDATLRVWVPSSQILVGQVNLTLNSDQTESVLMEWVALLEPFPGGTPMSAVDQRINTVLAGKTKSLEPVFLLTGMPRTNISAYPSLSLELALRPSAPRQITWVLSSLENKDLSFYTARRFAASSLENEQLKLEVTQKKRFFAIGSQNSFFTAQIQASQNCMDQLLMPAFGKFRHQSIVSSRIQDNGFSQSRDGGDSGPGWGIQTSLDAFTAARILLPSSPEILKGLLQNFLDQQADNGTLEMLTSWTGKKTGKLATPVLAGLAFEIYNYTQDKVWLGRVFPQLLSGLNAWFSEFTDRDLDGFPEWQHILQTGFKPSNYESDEGMKNLEILIKAAESPALAALLFKECENLATMAAVLDFAETTESLVQKGDSLKELVQSCWNEKESYFQYRDLFNHSLKSSVKIVTYRRNGHFPLSGYKSFSSSTVVEIQRLEATSHEFEIQIQTIDQIQKLTEKSFDWRGTKGSMVINSSIGDIKFLDIRGLKKSEMVLLSEPAFEFFDPYAVIPFWAGCAAKEQTVAFLQNKLSTLETMVEENVQFPVYIKFMLLEMLIRNQRHEDALRLYENWYGKIDESSETPIMMPLHSLRSLEDLVPIQILLSLYGVEKWTSNEVILENNSALLPPITVQYGQTTIEFKQGIRVVKHANGESTTLDQAGKVKVLTA